MPSSSESSSSSSSSDARRKRKRERKEKKEKKRERKKERKKKRRKHDKREEPPGPSKLPLVPAADEFRVGDAVLYTARDGSHKHATIVKVHTDDVVPYFTVSVDGAEKQTERARLAKPSRYRISKVPKPPPAAPPAPAIDDLGRLQRVLGGTTAAAAEPPREPPRRVMGAQRPEDAAAERERLQQIQRVWDPSLGVYRSVRLSGEVVEESVSRGEQQRLMAAKARHVGPVGPPTAAQSFTGREKFPSQHPWFGYK